MYSEINSPYCSLAVNWLIENTVLDSVVFASGSQYPAVQIYFCINCSLSLFYFITPPLGKKKKKKKICWYLITGNILICVLTYYYTSQMTSEILLEIHLMKPQKVYRAVGNCILNTSHSLKILIYSCLQY